jgi:hypothetical protein
MLPHGLRHGHQTWMDEDRVADVLKAERMGHEVPGMRGAYGHVTTGMRDELKAVLEQRRTSSLRERAGLSPRVVSSGSGCLPGAPRSKIGSQTAPKNGHPTASSNATLTAARR